MKRVVLLLLSVNLLLSLSMGAVVNAKTISKSEQISSMMTQESKQETQLDSEAPKKTEISSFDKTMKNVMPSESSDIYEKETQETTSEPKNVEDMDILQKIKEQNKSDIENSQISNKIVVKDTGKAFGEEHTFSESLNVQAVEPLKNVDLVIEITQPYKGWLDEDKITTPDIYGASKATYTWTSDTTLQISYHFSDFDTAINFEVPIKVTSGNRVGSNPENPTLVQSYLKTEDGRTLAPSESKGELIGKINELSVWGDSFTTELTVGKGELVEDGLRGWKYNTYDTELANGKLDGVNFTIKNLRISSPKIYLGKIIVRLTIPENIYPVIHDSKHASYDKNTRILTYQTDQSIDSTNGSTSEISFNKAFSFTTWGFPNQESRMFSYEIYGVNDLDKDYQYPLSVGKNYKFFVNAVSQEKKKIVSISASYSDQMDSYFNRNTSFGSITGKVILQSMSSQSLLYVMDLTQDKETGVAVSPNKVNVSLGDFEGSYNVYVSNDGTTNGKLLAENVTTSNFSTDIEDNDYHFVVLKANAGFRQEATFSTVTNQLTVGVKLKSKEKIYPKKDSPIKKFTANFTADGEKKSLSKSIEPAANTIRLTSTSDKHNVTNNETFTETLNLTAQQAEYYEGRGTFVALMPQTLLLDSLTVDNVKQNYKVIDNYKNTGKKAVIFYDESLDRIKNGGYSVNKKVSFSYKGNNDINDGNFTIDYYYVLPDIYQENEKRIGYSPSGVDQLDINDNENTSESVSQLTSNYVYRKTKELIPSIYAKGSATDNYLGMNDTTKSHADNPIFDIKLQLSNNFDSSPVSNITEIVKIPKKDILDFSGEKVDNAFDTFLTNITLPDPQKFDIYYLAEDAKNLSKTNEASYEWKTKQPPLRDITAIKYSSKASYQLPSQSKLEATFSIKAENVSTESLNRYLNSTMIYKSGDTEYAETAQKKMQVISAKQDLKIQLISTNGQPLNKGSFDLYDSQNVFVNNYVLNGQSSLTIPDLNGDKYTLKQTVKDDNYQYVEQNQTIELSGLEKDEKIVTIVNRPKAVSFDLHNSTLYLGDSWKPEDNILIKDYENVDHVPNESNGYRTEFVSTGTVNTQASGRYVVEYQMGTTKKTATIQVIKGLVTDPSDSETVLEGKDGDQDINGHIGMLKINYISDLDFGKATYNYENERGLSVTAKKDERWKQKDVDPFINIENRRDSNGFYTISAQLTKPFVDENQEKLKGATLYFENGNTSFSDADIVTDNLFVLEPDWPATRVVESNTKGSKSLSFANVELLLPGQIYQRPGHYTGEITWSIEMGP
ncbi:WxL domain-containing protein [Enterococcus faecalis]|uniref:WxL domain-containing protein n=2 Tax=Enterococcus faecalis TaxID=1351 RepID=UPI0002D6FBCC|nr:WxL domain-containing protein [Enterococcus faecalis]